MECLRIKNGATETISSVMVKDEALLSGATVLLSIRRRSDNKFYDFSDSTFKASGWVEKEHTMTEVIGQPGYYEYQFNSSGFSDDSYLFYVACDSADNVPQAGEIKVGDFVDNLDAAVSSRSTLTAGQVDTQLSGTHGSGSWGGSSAPEIAEAVWENTERTLTEGTKDTEIDAIKEQTDKMTFDRGKVIATLNGETVLLAEEHLNYLKYILGLSQQNYRIFSPTYSDSGKLVTCTIKIYETAQDCVSDLNPLRTYSLLAEYNSQNLMINYRVTGA